MIMRMIQLSTKKAVKAATINSAPPMPGVLRAGASVMDHKTADSC